MKVATAGSDTVELNALYVTGTIVTGVLTSGVSSDVFVVCLQEIMSPMVIKRHKK
jgi:hypothetical protein